MTEDIPPLRPAHLMPPIRTHRDLEQHWRALMGPLGFGQTLLWICFVQPDGMMVPGIVTVEENPPRPDDEMIANLVRSLQEVIDEGVPGTQVAGLWTRPGRGPISGNDRAWLRAIHDGFARGGLGAWPLHFANDSFLRVVAPDDLAA